MCLPSDALSQHLPSHLGFSFRGSGVSLHGCSSKAQLLLLTLDEVTPPDLDHGVATASALLKIDFSKTQLPANQRSCSGAMAYLGDQRLIFQTWYQSTRRQEEKEEEEIEVLSTLCILQIWIFFILCK